MTGRARALFEAAREDGPDPRARAAVLRGVAVATGLGAAIGVTTTATAAAGVAAPAASLAPAAATGVGGVGGVGAAGGTAVAGASVAAGAAGAAGAGTVAAVGAGAAGVGAGAAGVATAVTGGAIGMKLVALGGLIGAAGTALGVVVTVSVVTPESPPPPRTPSTIAGVGAPASARAGDPRASHETGDARRGATLSSPVIRRRDPEQAAAATSGDGAGTSLPDARTSPSAAAAGLGAVGARDQASDLANEAQMVTEARRALVSGDPARALALVRGARKLPVRALEPEELGLEARALQALGRSDEAAAVELVLRRRFPDHALAR